MLFKTKVWVLKPVLAALLMALASLVTYQVPTAGLFASALPIAIRTIKAAEPGFAMSICKVTALERAL